MHQCPPTSQGYFRGEFDAIVEQGLKRNGKVESYITGYTEPSISSMALSTESASRGWPAIPC